MPLDYKKEWMEKSSIDYFSPFISLWLACNSWYMSHYSEINGSDRKFIDMLKGDKTGRNHLFSKFCDLIVKDDRSGIAFRTNLELLHYSLERAALKPDKISACSFRQAVTDYNNKDKTENLIEKVEINPISCIDPDGYVDESNEYNVIKLDRIYITSDKGKFFAGLLEIIYQVRNMLVHGKINPDKDEHEVVKYCYLILWDLMN